LTTDSLVALSCVAINQAVDRGESLSLEREFEQNKVEDVGRRTLLKAEED